MNTTPQPPTLSDRLLSIIASLEGNVSEWVIDDLLAIHDELEIYEAARAKDAELIQMAVNACTDPHKMSLSGAFLSAAAAAGFTPTEP